METEAEIATVCVFVPKCRTEINPAIAIGTHFFLVCNWYLINDQILNIVLTFPLHWNEWPRKDYIINYFMPGSHSSSHLLPPEIYYGGGACTQRWTMWLSHMYSVPQCVSVNAEGVLDLDWIDLNFNLCSGLKITNYPLVMSLSPQAILPLPFPPSDPLVVALWRLGQSSFLIPCATCSFNAGHWAFCMASSKIKLRDFSVIPHRPCLLWLANLIVFPSGIYSSSVYFILLCFSLGFYIVIYSLIFFIVRCFEHKKRMRI